MPDTLRLLLAALACYRLAQLIALDDGPADMFLRMREQAGAYRYGPDGRPDSGWGRLVACPYCVGVWLAIPCVALAYAGRWWSDAVLAVLATAGIQAFLQGVRHDRPGE